MPAATSSGQNFALSKGKKLLCLEVWVTLLGEYCLGSLEMVVKGRRVSLVQKRFKKTPLSTVVRTKASQRKKDLKGGIHPNTLRGSFLRARVTPNSAQGYL